MSTLRMIFCRSSNLASPMIRAAEGWGLWAHCGLLLPTPKSLYADGMSAYDVVEARAWHGVVLTPLHDVIERSSAHELVELPVPSAPLGEMRAASQLGRPYDWLGAFAVWARRREWNDPQREFCSELVAAAIECAGLPIVHRSMPGVGPGRLYQLVYAAGGRPWQPEKEHR